MDVRQTIYHFTSRTVMIMGAAHLNTASGNSGVAYEGASAISLQAKPCEVPSMNLLEWIAALLQSTGAFLLALNIDASPWAYPVMLTDSLLWLPIAFRRDDRALGFTMTVFAMINLVGVYRWLT